MEEKNYNLKPLDQQTVDKAIEEISNKYRVHQKGLFIVAPSGAGKTHFCKNQQEQNWIDGDILWKKSEAHPDRTWWLEGLEAITEVDKRSDEVTKQAKEKGLWIMGASNNWLKPDAIVIPDWDEHVKYIKHREENNYDGGAKSNPEALAQVQSHIAQISEWEKEGIPTFKSINEATKFLTS